MLQIPISSTPRVDCLLRCTKVIRRFMKRNGPVVATVRAESDNHPSNRKRSGKQLSESMQKGIAANFAKCWRKYLADGEVKDFLVRSSSLFPSHQYGVQYTSIAKQVLLERPIDSNHASISPPRAGDTKVLNAAEQAKVAQRCLMAIGGLWCQREAIPAVRALAAACVEIGESLDQRLSPEEEALVKAEIDSVLSYRYSAERCEGEHAEAPGPGPGPGPVLDQRDTHSERVVQVSEVAVGFLRRSPALSAIRPAAAAVDACLEQLLTANAWASAARVVKLYPHSVGLDRFRSLVASLAHGTHLELGADLLKFALLLARSGRAAPVGASPAAATPPQPSGFLADIAEAELVGLVHAQLRAYTGLGTGESLSVAVRLAQAFRLGPQITELEALQRKKKLAGFLDKGKWQICVELLERKSMPRKVELFSAMLERGLFYEASVIYKRFELHRGRLPPITPAQLEQQRTRNAARYLDFPLRIDSVLHVVDAASLTEAARILTVSLEEDTQPGTSYLKPVSPQELAGAPDGDAEARAARMQELRGRYRCVVGLDCEWSFSMDPRAEKRGCSIIQIATADRVLILHLRELLHPSQAERRELTRRFVHNLFSDEGILKAGWDFGNQDIKMLRNNADGFLSSALGSISSYVELSASGERLLPRARRGGAVLGDGEQASDENLRSLSGACAAFLGQPLHKSEQMSDWDKLPLSEPQVRYASLDAHATLALLDVMLRMHLSLEPHAQNLSGAANYYPHSRTGAATQAR